MLRLRTLAGPLRPLRPAGSGVMNAATASKQRSSDPADHCVQLQPWHHRDAASPGSEVSSLFYRGQLTGTADVTDVAHSAGV